MGIIIGSARIDERGRISGGAAGDQKQAGKDDYKGEVSMQVFYEHKKGWYVLRPVLPDHAEAIARNMADACNNPNLGYDQDQRLGVVTNGIHSKKKTECDCSSLVRECVKEATGVDPGNFTTGDEAGFLENAKKDGEPLFEKRKRYTSGMKLYTGDVLVTCTRGHTVIVTVGADRKKPSAGTPKDGKKTAGQIAEEVIAGKWGNGDDRKKRLESAGYDFGEVQKKVNALLK